MSVSMNNLFNYSRALPEPFDKLTNKKVKVTSKYDMHPKSWTILVK